MVLDCSARAKAAQRQALSVAVCCGTLLFMRETQLLLLLSKIVVITFCHMRAWLEMYCFMRMPLAVHSGPLCVDVHTGLTGVPHHHTVLPKCISALTLLYSNLGMHAAEYAAAS